MRFLIDECLMPDLDGLAHKMGFECTSVRNLGQLSAPDWNVASFAIENDHLVVTHNSKDFRGLKGRPGLITGEPLHPGLICLNSVRMTRNVQRQLFQLALDFIVNQGIADLLNTVIELDHLATTGEVDLRVYEAPVSQ